MPSKLLSGRRGREGGKRGQKRNKEKPQDDATQSRDKCRCFVGLSKNMSVLVETEGKEGRGKKKDGLAILGLI